MKPKFLEGFLLVALAVFLVVVYKRYDPSEADFFPPCPFRELTGLQCPGCGSQRAVHYLLDFDFSAARKANVLLVIFTPYLLVGFVLHLLKHPARKIMFGRQAIFIMLAFVVAFGILRNCF